MTALLDRAIQAARDLPAQAQDDIARILLQLLGADDEEPISLTRDEKTALTASLTAAERGELATDEQVRKVWAKHNL